MRLLEHVNVPNDAARRGRLYYQLVFGHRGHDVDVLSAQEVAVCLDRPSCHFRFQRWFNIRPGGVYASDTQDYVSNLLAIDEVVGRIWASNSCSVGREVWDPCDRFVLYRLEDHVLIGRKKSTYSNE